MAEMNIKTEGRTLVDQNLETLVDGRTVQTLKYNDGTILRITVDGGEVNVECNKKVEVLPDGVTVRIIN